MTLVIGRLWKLTIKYVIGWSEIGDLNESQSNQKKNIIEIT